MYCFLRFLFRNILIDKILEKISCMSILLLETILMTKQTVCESYFSVYFFACIVYEWRFVCMFSMNKQQMPKQNMEKTDAITWVNCDNIDIYNNNSSCNIM